MIRKIVPLVAFLVTVAVGVPSDAVDCSKKINSPPNAQNAYRLYDSLECALGGTSNIGRNYRPGHWHENVIFDRRGGSANLPLAEAAYMALSHQKFYNRVRPWWIEYFNRAKTRMQEHEARSGIYSPLIVASVGGINEAAIRRGDHGLQMLAREWLDAFYAHAALTSYPVRLSGRWKVTTDLWGVFQGTGEAYVDQPPLTFTSRGQRSWEGKAYAGLPNTKLNYAVHRAITGSGRSGVRPLWEHLMPNMWPGRELQAQLQRVVSHPHDLDNLRAVVARTYGYRDGCEVLRFERGAATVTTRNINGNTAPLYLFAVTDTGDVEALALDRGNRHDLTKGEAMYHPETRRVGAMSVRAEAEPITYRLPPGRYGALVYHIKYPPRGGAPEILFPDDGGTITPPPPPPPPPTNPIDPPPIETPCSLGVTDAQASRTRVHIRPC